MLLDLDAYPGIVVPVVSCTAPLASPALFGGEMPLEVDAGCGKGRFLLARAAAFPAVGFIGIERQQRRVAKIAKKAAQAGLRNLRLLHADIRFAVEGLIPDGAVRCFYLFFPDPWPKRRHHIRRLLHADTLALLHRKLTPGGQIHFATDHDDYYRAVQALFDIAPGFDPAPPFIPAPEERTDFELIFAGQGKTALRRSLCKRA